MRVNLSKAKPSSSATTAITSFRQINSLREATYRSPPARDVAGANASATHPVPNRSRSSFWGYAYAFPAVGIIVMFIGQGMKLLNGGINALSPEIQSPIKEFTLHFVDMSIFDNVFERLFSY